MLYVLFVTFCLCCIFLRFISDVFSMLYVLRFIGDVFLLFYVLRFISDVLSRCCMLYVLLVTFCLDVVCFTFYL